MLLSEAIGNFKADRLAKGYASGTVYGQDRTLRQLLADIGNIHVHSIQPKHLDTFWSKRSYVSAGTYNNKRNQLSSFFAWCKARSLMPRDADPLEGTRVRKVPPKDRLLIPPSKWDDLLGAAPNPRDRALVAMGLYTFQRVSELTALKVSSLDMAKGIVHVVRQKNTTEDFLPICSELDKELRRWLLAYGENVGEVPQPGWYLFPPYVKPKFSGTRSPGHGGGYILPGSSPLMPHKRFRNPIVRIQGVLRAAGHTDLLGEGGHTLRRSGARALYEELAERGHDRSIRIVQGMLGHANIATTEGYLGLSLDRKARNDLLAGKSFFTPKEGAQVIALDGEGTASG